MFVSEFEQTECTEFARVDGGVLARGERCGAAPAAHMLLVDKTIEKLQTKNPETAPN